MTQNLKLIIEATLLAAGEPLSIDKIKKIFEEEERPSTDEIKKVLEQLQTECAEKCSVELKELASGYCFQIKSDYAPWIARLWEERPPRYSRALLETLAIIAYKQPATRAEVEDIRGVAVSTNIMRTLLEREWVKVIGHRDVPGKPAIYGTTKAFLDYFNLKSLEELPTLQEIQDLDKVADELAAQLELDVSPQEVEEPVA